MVDYGHLRQLHNNGTLDEIFGAMEEDILRSWKVSDPCETSERENLYTDLKALQRLRGKMRSVLDDERFR